MATAVAMPVANLLHFLPSSSDPPHDLIRTHPSLTLLSTCKSIQTFKQIHSQFIKFGLHNTHFAQSKLLHFCAVAPSGDLSYAQAIFTSTPNPNHVIFNTIIRGYSISPFPNLALQTYAHMLSFPLIPNSYTFPFILKSCTSPASVYQVHSHVVKFGLGDDVYVNTSLVNAYARYRSLNDARKVFDRSCFRDAALFTALITGYVSRGYVDEARDLFDAVPIRDVVCWNAMISGYAQLGRLDEALNLFDEMRKKGSVTPDVSTMLTVLSVCGRAGNVEMGDWIRSWIVQHGFDKHVGLVNAMINMYAKCGLLEVARSLFNGLGEKDVISWNVMIGGYSRASMYKEALEIFRKMQMNEAMRPNDVTFLNLIPACANLGALDLGKWIHAYIEKHYRDFENETLWTSLIDMYAKCGSIEAAKHIFNSLESKNLASWNVMISALAMHGEASRAIELFSEMINEGIQPDEITFVSILSACCHSGMVDVGRKFFNSMQQDYNVIPQLQHYGCMIDILSRAGLLEEATALVKIMEMKPDSAIWGAILAGCRLHKNLELAELAAEKLFELEPDNPSTYVLLSNVYASVRDWDGVARMRTLANDQRLKKVPGSTSIEVDGVVHEFLVSDRMHPESQEIYRMMEEVERVLEEAGYVADASEANYEEWKEGAVCEHSERLAIAYGLIKTTPGSTLRVVKNLRVCENCHEATKMISKAYGREIVARDRNRFHHFKDGRCSCHNYW